MIGHSRPGVGVIHLDETGAPCTRHPSPDLAGLTTLAAIGSRAASFSHDLASKLQRLIMAISELDELATADPSMRVAIEAAQSALSELQLLFVEHRSLARSPIRETIGIAALVDAARLRVGVLVQADLPARSLHIHVAAVTNALSQLLDLVAVRGPRGRITQISAQIDGAELTLALATPNPLPVDDTALALATFVFATSGGALRCTPDALLVRLPLA